MTQLALTNEEVVNFGVESAEKLFVRLRSKLSGVNRRVFPLNSTGSVPAEVAFWKLPCCRKFEHQRKFFAVERYSHLQVLRNYFLCYLWYMSYFRRVLSPAQNQELLILLLLVTITAIAGIQQRQGSNICLRSFLILWYIVKAPFVALDSPTGCISSLIDCQL